MAKFKNRGVCKASGHVMGVFYGLDIQKLSSFGRKSKFPKMTKNPV
jgi:hypothetical protein